jgi:hypothetical protein
MTNNFFEIPDGDFNMQEYRAWERRAARQTASYFHRAVEAGDVDQFIAAAELLRDDETPSDDAWRLAMKRIGKLSHASPEIRSAFVSVWVETKMLALTVGNRRVLADALRVLMPGDYNGPPLRLYRGALARERRGPAFGFSWTRDFNTAKRFTDHNAASLGPSAFQRVTSHRGARGGEAVAAMPWTAGIMTFEEMVLAYMATDRKIEANAVEESC